MCSSIHEFGFKIPVLARSDGEVVDGHLRLKSARKLGIVEIPVILCDEWTPVQVKAFQLMVIAVELGLGCRAVFGRRGQKRRGGDDSYRSRLHMFWASLRSEGP